MNGLIRSIEEHGRRTPGRVAIAGHGGDTTYGDLRLHVHRYAVSLQAVDRSLGPVGIALPGGIDRIVADLAVMSAGRATVALPSFLACDPIDAVLADAGASALIGTAGVRLLDGPPVALPAGTAKIGFGSRADAGRRLLCLSHDEIAMTSRSFARRLCIDGDRRHLALLPLDDLVENVAGLYATLSAGGVYLVGHDAEARFAGAQPAGFAALAAHIEAWSATTTTLTPAMLEGLIGAIEARGRGLPQLDAVLVSGGPVGRDTREAARAAGLRVLQSDRISEAGPIDASGARRDTVGDAAGPRLRAT